MRKDAMVHFTYRYYQPKGFFAAVRHWLFVMGCVYGTYAVLYALVVR